MTAGYTLITGASGFIGRALENHLKSKPNVLWLSRRQTDTDVPFRRGEFHSWEDLRQLDDLQIRCLVHLAAVTGGCSEEDGLAVNVLGTRRLVRYLVDRGCRKFVMASSVAATGCLDPGFLPLRVPIPDDHPCLARDAYGLSKAMMEELCGYFARLVPDSNFICLRIGSVQERWLSHPVRIGEKMPVPFIQLASVGINDVVRAIQMALDAPYKPGLRVLNLVGPDASCVEPVAEVLRAGLGECVCKLDLSWYERAGHEFDPIFAMQRIEGELGFRPNVTTR